jgi:ribosomal protein S18 acetylase RimI-like enzyme
VTSGPKESAVGSNKLADLRLLDLGPAERERAVPVIKEGFTGIYRWHAKRTLRTATWVRAVEVGDGKLVGVAILDRLAPEVGYVYYLSVSTARRGSGLGGLLLDDALAIFRKDGASVAYGAVEADNEPSLRLFRSRGFRSVERRELGYLEGGLGAWGLRSKMTLVGGELLLGLRLGEPPAP